MDIKSKLSGIDTRFEVLNKFYSEDSVEAADLEGLIQN